MRHVQDCEIEIINISNILRKMSLWFLVKTYVKIKIFKVYQEILIKIISDIMGNMDFFVFPTKKK